MDQIWVDFINPMIFYWDFIDEIYEIQCGVQGAPLLSTVAVS
jgi:hypothetical protein